ncbi:MAG: sugar nucleotide-binding protein [Ignavibacteria bacterium]|nr:sugar nucleotide-binding protein [Ignavibacteria bacterium]
MTKILLTGSSGYLGSHICRFVENEKVFALYKNNRPASEKVEPVQIDLLNSEDLNFLFREIKPDYIIHLAGIIPSQISNFDEKFIFQMNVELTKQISSLSHTFNSFLIFTSSDLVYDEGDDINEEHPLKPVNFYAHTKLEAEKAINKYGKFFMILRTALMYGFSISSHKSFFDYAFIQLMNGKEVKAFYDQFRNPLFVEEAAKFILMLTQIKLRNQDVMNFCGFEKLSRYEMVLRTAEVFNFHLELVQKESCDNFKEYKMAKNLSLNFNKMKKLNFIPAPYINNLKYLKENFEIYKPFLSPDLNKM